MKVYNAIDKIPMFKQPERKSFQQHSDEHTLTSVHSAAAGSISQTADLKSDELDLW